NGLNGTSSGRLYQRNTTTVTLTLGNGDANGTYPGQILDVSGGTINLVKAGTGKQILSGANSYAGSTTVNGGVLQFNTAGSMGGGGGTITLTGANPFVSAGAGLSVGGGAVIAKAFTNGGSLTVSSGLLRITAKPAANDPTGKSTVSSVNITTGGVVDLTNNSM